MYIKFLENFVRIMRIIRMYPYKRSFLRTFGPEGRDTEILIYTYAYTACTNVQKHDILSQI